MDMINLVCGKLFVFCVFIGIFFFVIVVVKEMNNLAKLSLVELM